MSLSQKEIYENTEVAAAAHNLVVAMDETIPFWRQETLNQNDGDIVNMAWELLIEALEGTRG